MNKQKTDAMKKYMTMANYRRRKKDELVSDENHPHHGTTTGYTYGCRCSWCQAARRAYDEKVRVRRKMQSPPPPQVIDLSETSAEMLSRMQARKNLTLGLDEKWEM